MKKVYFVNGSPRGKESVSQYFIGEIMKLINKEKVNIDEIALKACFNKGNLEEYFEKLAAGDILVWIFPLYVDSIPSNMLDFLEQFEEYIRKNMSSNIMQKSQFPQVYALINCGFIEGEQCKIAARIMANFCDKVGFKWKFAIGIGAGEFMRGSKDMPIDSKMKKSIYDSLCILKNHIEEENFSCRNSLFTSPKMPKKVFTFMADKGWIKMAKKNGVSKKKLYEKPYC
jgi:hypothetical protein